ncbi:uncharacterized protein EI97DRAFT_472845, partial [Westerdykella ornata]
SSTFSEPDELIRDASKMLPRQLYRVFYETSVTLSCYVGTELHVQHREKPKLRLREGNAFQAIADFSLSKDLNTERIRRHTKWQQKKHPSSYISAFNNISKFHYYDSQRIGHRVSIAEISTEGLVAATVRRTVEETVGRWQGLDFLGKEVTTRHEKIPVWVNESIIPSDRSDIPVAQLKGSKYEMWLSITELRRCGSDFRLACSKGHDFEWLAAGAIPKSRITRVMPFDGETLHKYPELGIVRSIRRVEPYFFDYKTSTWQLEVSDARKRKPESEARKGQKRPKTTDDVGEESGRIPSPKPSEDVPATCPTCGHTLSEGSA